MEFSLFNPGGFIQPLVLSTIRHNFLRDLETINMWVESSIFFNQEVKMATSASGCCLSGILNVDLARYAKRNMAVTAFDFQASTLWQGNVALTSWLSMVLSQLVLAGSCIQ